KTGPATRKVIEELIAAKAILAQAYQSCRNVLSMGKHGNKPILPDLGHGWVSNVTLDTVTCWFSSVGRNFSALSG
ncbi:hypothetical protein, partial [Corynebacterium guaraldiae]|uniref:hypothetical protein n=1 Tax=Corynebacterium guaraldiae TaxID=3051103 RepID=UPI001E2A26A7